MTRALLLALVRRLEESPLPVDDPVRRQLAEEVLFLTLELWERQRGTPSV
ncbi:MAG: hypothetical protein KF764_34500 [Labilithrix sp.]|nr:hypothetical protein [Labilithrix sp.]